MINFHYKMLANIFGSISVHVVSWMVSFSILPINLWMYTIKMLYTEMVLCFSIVTLHFALLIRVFAPLALWMLLTLRAPSARYLASEWRCVAPVGDETRRAATPVQSPLSTNLPPAVPCCGKFHLPRSPMSGCKTWLHEIGAEISVAMFSVYQKFVGLAILVEN